MGARIDYALVDQDFCKQHVIKGGELANGGRSCMAPESSAAAALAATLGGLSQPVSFAGGGMSMLKENEYRAQFGKPGTGLIYTPPQLSDHIGISLLLRDVLVGGHLQQDAATKHCQPHRKTKKITEFFSKRAATVDKKTPEVSAKIRQEHPTAVEDAATAAKKRELTVVISDESR